MFLEKAYLTSDITRTQLPSGLTVITKEIYPAKVACFGVWIKRGSLEEKNEERGISHFIEHMLFKRTPKRGLGEISRQINSLGGYLNGATSYSFTNYWVVAPSKYLDVAMDIQTDAVLNPIFDDYDIEKERKVIIEEIKMGEDTPSNYLFDKLMENAYLKHPLKHPVIGYEEVLNKIDKNKLRDFYSKNYTVNNMVITVVGDIKSEEVLSSVSDLYKHLPEIKDGEVCEEGEPKQAQYRYKEYYADIRKAYIAVGFHISSVIHRDIYALDLLSVVLGAGLSSRLNVALKEKKQLVNYIHSGILSGRFPGLLLIEANLEKQSVDEAINEIFIEIDKIKNKPVPPLEVKKSKNLFLSDYIFSQETVEGQCETLGYYEILGDCMLAEDYPKRVLEVSSHDISRVANDYLRKENCTITAYLPK